MKIAINETGNPFFFALGFICANRLMFNIRVNTGKMSEPALFDLLSPA